MIRIFGNKNLLIYIIAFSALVLTFLPYVIGIINGAINHTNFILFYSPEVQDINSYFAWIQQAVNGKLVFSDLYTTEVNNGLFAPIFLIIGLVNYFFSIPLVIVWLSLILISNITLLFVLYKFVKYFTNSHLQSVLSYFIIVLGGGFGWIIQSPDYYQPEFSIYQILRWPIVMSLSLSLLLASFLLVEKNIHVKNKLYTWLPGLFGLMIVLIHPYDILTYYRVIVIFIFSGLLLKKIPYTFQQFINLLPIIILPLLGLFYYYILFSREWVFLVNALASMRFPTWIEYLLGFGFIAILAVIGLVYLFFKEPYTKIKYLVLYSWVGTTLLLFLFPLIFQRKMIMGMIIPLAIFASIGIEYIFNRISILRDQIGFNIFKWSLVLCMIINLTATNIIIFYGDINRVNDQQSNYFLSNEMKESLDWLKNHNIENRVILSSFETSNIIPAQIGQRVYLGHIAQTINFELKLKMVGYFFNGELNTQLQQKIMSENNIGYILIGSRERSLYELQWLEQNNNYYLAFSNSQVKIYEVKK